MLTELDFLRGAWRRLAVADGSASGGGRADRTAVGGMPGLDVLRASEQSGEFRRLQVNRLVMGAFRYGRLGAAGKPGFDRVGDAIRRLGLYAADGNLEHLVDVANLCEVEFVEGTHPGRHWAAGDDGEHTGTAKKTMKCAKDTK